MQKRRLGRTLHKRKQVPRRAKMRRLGMTRAAWRLLQVGEYGDVEF
jgi:hypothetical protein